MKMVCIKSKEKKIVTIEMSWAKLMHWISCEVGKKPNYQKCSAVHSKKVGVRSLCKKKVKKNNKNIDAFVESGL